MQQGAEYLMVKRKIFNLIHLCSEKNQSQMKSQNIKKKKTENFWNEIFVEHFCV